MSIGHREMAAVDLPFVKDTWLRAFQYQHDAGPIPMSRYFEVYQPVLDGILARDECRVLVAHHHEAEEPELNAMGWICLETGLEYHRGEANVNPHEPVVHFLYVKQPFRRMGVAKYLLWAAGVDTRRVYHYTFRTAQLIKLRSKIGVGRFDPLLVRFPRTTPKERHA